SGALSGKRKPFPRPSDLLTQGHRPSLRRLAVEAQNNTRSQLLDRLLVFSAALLLVMTLISVELGWVTAGRVLRPLRRITERARSLSETNLHERIGLEGPRDELH